MSAGTSSLAAALAWLQGTLLGSVAIGVCVIAVAWVGFMMLQGRFPVKEGVRVIVGCFVLLGAPVIASGLLGVMQGGGSASPAQSVPMAEIPAR